MYTQCRLITSSRLLYILKIIETLLLWFIYWLTAAYTSGSWCIMWYGLRQQPHEHTLCPLPHEHRSCPLPHEHRLCPLPHEHRLCPLWKDWTPFTWYSGTTPYLFRVMSILASLSYSVSSMDVQSRLGIHWVQLSVCSQGGVRGCGIAHTRHTTSAKKSTQQMSDQLHNPVFC